MKHEKNKSQTTKSQTTKSQQSINAAASIYQTAIMQRAKKLSLSKLKMLNDYAYYFSISGFTAEPEPVKRFPKTKREEMKKQLEKLTGEQQKLVYDLIQGFLKE